MESFAAIPCNEIFGFMCGAVQGCQEMQWVLWFGHNRLYEKLAAVKLGDYGGNLLNN